MCCLRVRVSTVCANVTFRVVYRNDRNSELSSNGDDSDEDEGGGGGGGGGNVPLVDAGEAPLEMTYILRNRNGQIAENVQLAGVEDDLESRCGG